MTGQADGIPEYAKVIPKEQRTREAKQETCEEVWFSVLNEYKLHCIYGKCVLTLKESLDLDFLIMAYILLKKFCQCDI